MQKYVHIGTFPMGDTGPHIEILVLSVVPHFNSMVCSKILASSASVDDCGVVWDDRGEPPRILGHRPGPLGILNDQDSLLATTAGCQWFRTADSPSNRPVSVHDPSKSREAASRGRRSIWQRKSPVAFLCGLPASENLCDSWNANMWKEQHGHACSCALACESRTVTQREKTLK